MMRRALLLLVGVAACGQRDRADEPARAAGGPSSIEATPAAPDDPIVAKVDGRPVYGSCVAAQMQHLGVDKQAALAQCIDFELLAGAAEARGLRDDPDVGDAWRREMVRSVILDDLRPIDELAELPDEFIGPQLARVGPYLQRPYMRVVYYARFPVPKGAPPESPEEQTAKAAAEDLARTYADEDAVLWEPFLAEAERVAAAHKTPVEAKATPYQAPIEEIAGVRGAEPRFREALANLPGLGRTSKAVRARDGWFVILWWAEIPAADLTADFFASARVKYFTWWADRLAQSLGLDVSVDGEALAALAEEGE
jgi:hypothetical protein